MSETPRIGAITLFVRDRDEAQAWYGLLLTGLTGSGEPIWQDDVSVVFRLDGVMVNLLHVGAGAEFIAPDPVAGDGDPIRSVPIRSVATIDVDDVDAVVARLRGLGIEPSLEPVTRPWGPRTANLRDPSGHVWELATPAP